MFGTGRPARLAEPREPARERLALAAAVPAGGIGKGPDGYGGHVTFYVAVPDVEAALSKAESLGGTRVMGPEKVMDMVELGQFTDPEGHLIGLVKSE